MSDHQKKVTLDAHATFIIEQVARQENRSANKLRAH